MEAITAEVTSGKKSRSRYDWICSREQNSGSMTRIEGVSGFSKMIQIDKPIHQVLGEGAIHVKIWVSESGEVIQLICKGHCWHGILLAVQLACTRCPLTQQLLHQVLEQYPSLEQSVEIYELSAGELQARL